MGFVKENKKERKKDLECLILLRQGEFETLSKQKPFAVLCKRYCFFLNI